MVFKKIDSTAPVTDYLFAVISMRLARGKKVLWLMPGGSAIPIAQGVLGRLQTIDCSQLAITLTDERYGDVGHADENWTAIFTDVLAPTGANLVPVNHGKDIEHTTMDYHAKLKQLFEWADYRLGFFGIGLDGHTAGILPHTPAVYSLDLAASYDAGNFRRVTMTPLAIMRLNAAVVYAVGEPKHSVLSALSTSVAVDVMPSQVLKQADELVIFNDYIGD